VKTSAHKKTKSTKPAFLIAEATIHTNPMLLLRVSIIFLQILVARFESQSSFEGLPLLFLSYSHLIEGSLLL
jgi:hypothetical protein